MLTSDHYDFSVTEIFPDGRVLVFVYVRVHQEITAVMTVYPDIALRNGQRVMYYATPTQDSGDV